MFGEDMWGAAYWGGAEGSFYWKKVLGRVITFVGVLSGGLAIKLLAISRGFFLTAQQKLTQFTAPERDFRLNTKVRRDE